MPRGRLGGKARRVEMQALRYEQLCRETREQRREFRAREAALALRQSTPDWVELDAQLKRYQLEAEIKRSSASNQNSPPPPGGKNWKYDSIAEGYDPKDDWRNWE